ncbi:MAG: hypothetical protein IKW59_05950 [Clostridia bacterium]|nr:hypothetical protein [Clostridia bacterium]
MRKYTLASTKARNDVDLRQFSKFIEETVHEFMPEAMVEVEQNYYTVSPIPQKGIAVRIGRKLCSNKAMGKHCVKIPKLFYGINIDVKETKNEKQKRNGGHF